MQRSIKLFTPLVMLMLVACSGPFGTPLATDVLTKEAVFNNENLAEVDSPEMEFPIGGHGQACDVIAAHVAELADLPLPSEEWALQHQTQQSADVGVTRLFTNGPWAVQVSAPAILTGPVEYSVIVDHMSAILRWEGRIDSYGNIVETDFVQGAQPESPEKVGELSWIGVIISNPQGSQFDDYFQAMDQNGTRYGIDGADDVIKGKLISYRDTGTAVQVWGILQKDVPDAYGAQILVTRVEPY